MLFFGANVLRMHYIRSGCVDDVIWLVFSMTVQLVISTCFKGKMFDCVHLDVRIVFVL